MKIIVTGAGGQVGRELQRYINSLSRETELFALTRRDLDVTDAAQVEKTIHEIKPDWVINAAAYTAVDQAEDDKKLAHAINSEAVGTLAKVCQETQSRLMHISTDYVFDGDSSSSYAPTDATNPINIYGKSKLSGELQILHTLGEDTLIIRTGWVYSVYGHNFVKTMVRLMQERERLQVIDDQVGSPTWGGELARVIMLAVIKDARGLYHWTDAGVASWYDFANAILSNGKRLGVLQKEIEIVPISTEEYPTKARRPKNSVMCKRSIRAALDYRGRHWRETLEDMLTDVKNGVE